MNQAKLTSKIDDASFPGIKCTVLMRAIPMPYKIVERTPTVEEYNAVRLAAGLTVRDELAAQRGLSNTLFGICIVYNEAVVVLEE